MQYKTIMLELLEQQPELLERLKSQRKLLATLEQWSVTLKASHEAWTERVTQMKPDSDASQIASEAMELALEEVRNRLLSDQEGLIDLPSQETMTSSEPHSPPA